MPFDHHELAALPDIVAALRREWERLAAPGTWWSGAERVAIAAEARLARGVEAATPTDLPLGAREAARVLSSAPHSTGPGWVRSLLDAGLDHERYVELIGVVARLAAVDRLTTALGAGHEPLPEPRPGEPSRIPAEGTRLGRAWVPMPQGRSIVVALDHVPAETEAMKDLHGSLYLTIEEMADPLIAKGLGRPQMELIASRVSLLNQCFY